MLIPMAARPRVRPLVARLVDLMRVAVQVAEFTARGVVAGSSARPQSPRAFVRRLHRLLIVGRARRLLDRRDAPPHVRADPKLR